MKDENAGEENKYKDNICTQYCLNANMEMECNFIKSL